MKRTLIVTEHRTGQQHMCGMAPKQSATTLVETFQRNLATLGYPTGVSWRIHNGGLVSALIATAE